MVMHPAEEAFDSWLQSHLLHAPDPGCLRLHHFGMMEVPGHLMSGTSAHVCVCADHERQSKQVMEGRLRYHAVCVLSAGHRGSTPSPRLGEGNTGQGCGRANFSALASTCSYFGSLAVSNLMF